MSRASVKGLMMTIGLAGAIAMSLTSPTWAVTGLAKKAHAQQNAQMHQPVSAAPDEACWTDEGSGRRFPCARGLNDSGGGAGL